MVENSSTSSTSVQHQLIQAASPELYRQNPFRVLGVGVDATPGQMKKRQQELTVLEKIGTSPDDIMASLGSILPLGGSVDGDLLRQAFQSLQEPGQRLFNEFFWFWPVDAASEKDPALWELNEGRYQEAVAFWKGEFKRGSSIAAHNLAVYYHLLAIDMEYLAIYQEFNDKQLEQKNGYWRQAYQFWLACYDKSEVWERMKERLQDVDDPRVDSIWIDVMREVVPAVILKISALNCIQAAVLRRPEDVDFHYQFMKGFDWSSPVVKASIRLSMEPLLDHIRMLCSFYDREAQHTPDNIAGIIHQLGEQGRELLDTVDMFLEQGDGIREGIHNDLAAQMQKLVVIYANQTEDWYESLTFMEETLDWAESPSVRHKIAQNLQTIKNNQNQDKCYYCRREPKTDSSAYVLPMYGEITRVAEYNGERVHWQTAEVKIPRCPSCKRIHFWITIYYFASLCTLLFLIYMGVKQFYTATGWLLLPLLFAVLAIFLFVHEIDFIPERIINTQLTGIFKNYPLFVALKEQGWRVGHRPPGVS